MECWWIGCLGEVGKSVDLSDRSAATNKAVQTPGDFEGVLVDCVVPLNVPDPTEGR